MKTNWRLIQWIGGGTLALLFVFGVLIQYHQSTAATIERTSIITAKSPAAEPVVLTPEEIWAKGLEAVRSPDPGIRIRGIDILVAADKAKAGPIISASLGDPAPTVKIRAIGALAQMQMPGTGSQISRLLTDNDASVRAAAANALQKLAAEPGLAGYLATALASTDPGVVGSAVSVWKAVLPRDRRGAVSVIQTGLLGSNNDALLLVLAVLNQLTVDELRSVRPLLESLAARMPGQSSAAAAQNLIAKTDG